MIFGMMAALIAERGFQVIIQSVRGTSGSGGDIQPMRQEKADGADTLNWIRKQDWFADKLFTFGSSYLGNVQWAMACEAPDLIDALVLSVTLSNFSDELVSFGGFTQAGTLSWTQTELMMTEPGAKLQRPKPDSLDHAQKHLPLGTMDQAAFGKTVSWWQEWINHSNPNDPWWDAYDFSAAVKTLEVPTIMIGGWRDIFLPFQVRDFETRQAAGREAWLTIGPWAHASAGGMVEALRQAITTFTALKDGQQARENDRVRLYLQGADIWREFPSWPPPEAKSLCFHLCADKQLSLSPATEEGAFTDYVYDPANPTPAIHGPILMGGKKDRDMKELESRDDTVYFTSEALDRDLDVIGPVKADLSIHSDCEHTDFYVCLCDLDKKGRSLQVLDGYLRLRPEQPQADESGVRHITIECWPTAYRFKLGHKLRLIVASGAHPRYARNLGTGEALATATRMVVAHQKILHNSEHGSSLSLLYVD